MKTTKTTISNHKKKKCTKPNKINDTLERRNLLSLTLITSWKNNAKTPETQNEPTEFKAKKDNIPLCQYCKTNFA
jgi:hypothetical protein